jgi:hypothetical protein
MLYLLMIGANHHLPPVELDELVARWMQLISDIERAAG